MKVSRKGIIALVFSSVLSVSMFGCSAETPSSGIGEILETNSAVLDKDASLKSDWGTIAQYKVKSEWKNNETEDYDGFSSGSYGAEDLSEQVSIMFFNPNNILYLDTSDPTYSDWIEGMEERFDEFRIDTLESLEEIETKEVGDDIFRIYKLVYRTDIPDDEFEEVKAKRPETEQHSENEMYYAIYKEGDKNMEISASSEQLLSDFLDTLSIHWG